MTCPIFDWEVKVIDLEYFHSVNGKKTFAKVLNVHVSLMSVIETRSRGYKRFSF